MKKGEITLAYKAIDDVKLFYQTLMMYIGLVYNKLIPIHEYHSFNQSCSEDLAKMVIDIILKDEVYQVLICLVRVDCFTQDKDLREKYAMLRGVRTTDFGVDPYLSLMDPITLIKEIRRKNNIS